MIYSTTKRVKFLFGIFPLNRRSPKGDLSLTGFTLIEIMVVVIIIGILASIGLPRYVKAVEKARIAGALSVLDAIRTAQFRYASEYNAYAASLSNFDVNISSSDKYFSFSIVNANPFLTPGEAIGRAIRSDIQTVFPSLYQIDILENGLFNSTNSYVNNILQ